MVGLVAEGGQGLATANNGKYIGVKEGTKQAESIRETRIQKLDAFNQSNKTNYQMPDSEIDIWEMFEAIKNEYGLKAFGQGHVYKIVPDDMIADIDILTDVEKSDGIDGKKTFVSYDKGDKDGNRWYYETPFLINWSKENVHYLKNDSRARFQGHTYYFREGFCWNNNLNENYIDIKCKLKGKGVSDVASMSLYPMIETVPAFWLVLTINNRISGTIYRKFLNATVNVQMNDIKALPIIVPTYEQLEKGKELFEAAVEIQKQYYSDEIDESKRNDALSSVQEKIEAFIMDVYGLELPLK